jgi:hypothetical protein
MDLALIEKTLRMPSKQPEYRRTRGHSDFLVNLGLAPSALKTALAKTWGATEALTSIPVQPIRDLCAEKYARNEWNFKF